MSISTPDYQKNGFLDEKSWEFPNIINLNVLRGICPCRCIHCPIGLTQIDKRIEYFGEDTIEFSLYKKIVDEIAFQGKKGLLRIHSVGEPLLWNSLPEAVRYSKGKDVKTWIFTSAYTEDMRLLEILCENIDIIEVSVNSTTREDYLTTKGIDGFPVVTAAINYMTAYIQKYSLSTRLICSRVETKQQLIDDQFVEYWKNVPGIADAFVRSYHNYNGLLKDNGLLNGCLSEKHLSPCLVHWGRFNIDIDGTAVICFNELFKKNRSRDIILGNVITDSIESIWKSEKMNKLRRFLLGLSDERVGTIPCINCATCQEYPPKVPTSEVQIKALENKK